MKTDKVKEMYKDEWVLAEVIKEDELGQPIEVEVITHSKNRDVVYDELERVEAGKHVCTFYTGEMPKKGYAVAFLWVE